MSRIRNSRRGSRRAAAFSLIELVIVVVIIAIIGAIAIPRMSRGAAGAADSALTSNLQTLRSAVDLYATEHNGTYPAATDLTNALEQYSNAAGDSFGTKSSTRIYGPYLRKVPTLPVGANKGLATFGTTAPGATVTTHGWYYSATDGTIKANCTDAEVDSSSVKYNAY